jgi:transcriptional regulator
MDPAGVPQGTLDLMVLKTLALEPMHGFGIVRRLEQCSQGVFQLNPGSIFPSLRRLEDSGLIEGRWDRSENNRRARYYNLTRKGRRQLERHVQEWERRTTAVRRVLEWES